MIATSLCDRCVRCIGFCVDDGGCSVLLLLEESFPVRRRASSKNETTQVLGLREGPTTHEV